MATLQRSLPNLLFRKRSSWAYEHEWRMVRPLSTAHMIGDKDRHGYDVYLFEIPAKAVCSVLLGYRAPESAIAGALNKLDTPKWRHVQLLRRCLPGTRSASTGLNSTWRRWSGRAAERFPSRAWRRDCAALCAARGRSYCCLRCPAMPQLRVARRLQRHALTHVAFDF
jgi:hypothetical protein